MPEETEGQVGGEVNPAAPATRHADHSLSKQSENRALTTRTLSAVTSMVGRREPLTKPSIDPRLPDLPCLERVAESLRFAVLRLEYSVSKTGHLRWWARLWGLVSLAIAVPTATVISECWESPPLPSECSTRSPRFWPNKEERGDSGRIGSVSMWKPIPCDASAIDWTTVLWTRVRTRVSSGASS